MKTLAALILEDYLKFRGTLLIYILAGLLDQQREIKELAVELIMKYTLEKSEIFLRTCLAECPFVFNACPCFGQGISARSSILKGQAKTAAREYIYQYLIRKIEPVYLYMYFGNVARLHEFIQKDPSIVKSSDFQNAIHDFLFICAEICVVNEKQKRNLEKIIKESHNGEGIALNDEDDAAMTETNPEKAAETEKKGRGKKNNQPTLKQSLVAVEKIVPLISSIDNSLRSINQTMFAPILDKFCTNMCIHFESLLEYAQPRDFWAPFLKKAKKPTATATPRQSKRASAKVVQVMQPPSTPSRSTTPKPTKSKENDSGRFTLDDDDINDGSSYSKRNQPGPSKRSSSRASNRTISQASDSSISKPSKRGKKRLQTTSSQDDSDNESAFSELSDITALSQKHKNTQDEPGPSNKKAKKPPSTPKTPASRKSSRR